jgi:hypothetical protein
MRTATVRWIDDLSVRKQRPVSGKAVDELTNPAARGL